MAQRRMFSKSITNSSRFLKMPSSSRLLYYDLGMCADDDGFAEWYTVIKMTGATEQDMQVLQVNGFVKIFDENVLIILDWKVNNYLPKDRYTPSLYLDKYKSELMLENIQTGHKDCIQPVYKMDTQSRVDKDSIGKYSIVVREGKTPSQVMRDFIDNKENTQEQLVNYLVEKGIPREKAITELSKFLSYWTELNKSGTKQKWEMQDTFEVKRRLGTWFGNIKQDKTKQLIDLDKI